MIRSLVLSSKVAIVPDGMVNNDVAGPPLNVNTTTKPKIDIGLLMLKVSACGTTSSDAARSTTSWVPKASASESSQHGNF